MVAATGSILTAVIAAVCWGPNRIDVFRTGTANRDLQHLWWNGAQVNPIDILRISLTPVV